MELNLSNLQNIGAFGAVQVPTYSRNPHGSPTVVHISVGGFHRAHQAVYLDDLLQAGQAEGWRLIGVGLLPFDIPARDAMRAQDCLYTLVERDANGDSARIIASISQYFYAPDQQEDVIAAMADPSCRIVTLTITEGGYFIHQGTGKFNANHPDIVHDLGKINQPKSSFGYIMAALLRRKAANLTPFTILSCDNIQNNGNIARQMVVAFAHLIDPELASWLELAGAFPNCMVDRITPATTNQHRQLVREKFGVIDAWPVTCEPFRQWVIEDHFVQGRPPWEKVGAQMTSDVEPYELMKIRLLNGSHQALCYIGMLLGFRYAPEAMVDPDIPRLLKRLMDDEVTQLIPPIPGVDLEEYKKKLLERFTNPAVNDQLLRIGTEGSARIPKFVLPSIREALARGSQLRLMTFTVATWIYYLGQTFDEKGQCLEFADPMIEKIQPIARMAALEVREVLGISEVFGDLGNSATFTDQCKEILKSFYSVGARKTLQTHLDK